MGGRESIEGETIVDVRESAEESINEAPGLDPILSTPEKIPQQTGNELGDGAKDDGGGSTAAYFKKKTGFMMKKGMGYFYRPWARRYFVLDLDHSLTYYGK
jgi:hypothetical protein